MISSIGQSITPKLIYKLMSSKNKWYQHEQWRIPIEIHIHNVKLLVWRSTLHEFRLIHLWRLYGWHFCFNSFLNTLVTILMPRKQKWKHWRQWELQIGIFIYNVHIWTQWSIFNSVGLHNCHGSMDVIFWNSIPKHTIYSYIGKVA